jgi:hypothetical protein
MTVAYALFGSAALLIVVAGLLFAGIIDVGVDPLLLGGVLVAGAIIDLIMVAFVMTRSARL